MGNMQGEVGTLSTGAGPKLLIRTRIFIPQKCGSHIAELAELSFLN